MCFTSRALGQEAPDSATGETDRVKVLQLAPLEREQERPVVTALAISPDTVWIAAAGDDHAIRIIDFSTGKTLRTLQGHTDWVQALEFTPDGRALLSCGNDRQLWKWDSQNDWRGSIVFKAENALYTLAIEPSGSQVAVTGFGPRVWIHQIDQGRLVRTLECDCRDHRALQYSHSGRRLACGTRDGSVAVWDADNGQLLTEPRLHSDRIRGLAFSQDDTILTTVGEDRRVAQYDLQSNRTVLSHRIPGGRLMAMAALDSDCIAIAGSDDLIRKYCLATKQVKGKVVGHRGSITILRQHQDWLVSGSFDTTIRLWRLEGLWENPGRWTSTDALNAPSEAEVPSPRVSGVR
jgi:WD40 repeat protein